MGYGKVGVSKERMCSYKHTHNSAVHIEIIEDNNGNVTIKITNTLFVYNRGRKAKNTAMNAEDINSFLKGGTAKYKDKNVTLEINTQIVEVKNKREAIKNIEKNEGFGVVVKRDTRILFGSGNRSYHSFSEHNASGVDEIVLVREDYNNSHTVAHETGHDLGFADKYVDNFNVGKSQATIPFKDGLMGGLDPLNEFEINILIFDVLHNHSIDQTGRPVDYSKDRAPQGTQLFVVPYDPDKKQFDMTKILLLEIENSEGTPGGFEVKDEKNKGASQNPNQPKE